MKSTVAGLTLAPMTEADWPAAAQIYAAGIAGGNATFESQPPDWPHWRDSHVGDPMLVARDLSGELVGWAALGSASTRPVYRGVAEVSIYVAPEHVGRGVGRALLQELVAASERAGFWTLQAGIFPENTASIALHEGYGFEFVGVRRRIGQMPDGRWRDVRMYERRSTVVGQ